jgi:translation initiation factor 1 (eIF-1/SUI1)
MAKKIPTSQTPTSLAHNPFGGLQGLRAGLPGGPTAPTTTPATTPQRASSEFLEKVVVRHERKGHGGKTITVVTGVAPNARELICTALKKNLGCGARVDGDDIVLQGELVDRAFVWLEARGARKLVRGS